MWETIDCKVIIIIAITVYFQLLDVKEWSRQISELAPDDYALLHTATLSPHSSNTCDVSIATDEPVALQLCGLLDQLRMLETLTSDSGAVSDFSEPADCKSVSNTSLTLEGEDKETGECLKTQSDDTCTTIHVQAGIQASDCQESGEEDADRQVEVGGMCKESKNFNKEREISQDPEGQRLVHAEERRQVKQQSTLISDTAVVHLIDTAVDSHVDQRVDCDVDQHVDHPASKERDGSRRAQPEQRKTARKEREERSGDVPENSQPVRIRRKTKRYYGSNWRRNSGYHSNWRSRDQQSRFSRDVPKTPPHPSFNHMEVARFLWKSMLT